MGTEEGLCMIEFACRVWMRPRHFWNLSRQQACKKQSRSVLVGDDAIDLLCVKLAPQALGSLQDCEAHMKSSTSSSAKHIVMRQWKTCEKLARSFWGDPVVSGLWLRKL